MDVTELKLKEADIEQQAREKQRLMASEAAAKEASKLKGQFLANMSHEIRTPITGVIGMAELMLDLELGDEQREYTENIYRSANALLTVINDILDFSKVESGRLDIEEVQFSLSVVVRDVNKMLSFAAERKNLEFSSEISADIENDLAVLGDPGRVRQIITNLLTNSIKFTNQGYVKFSVLKEKETADTVEIKFVVEDTGIGIDEDVRKRLFQPFSQGDASTARKFGGTGLGLTICKSLLELMRGRMTLKSTIGSGTTATFWIPFNKPNNADANLVRIDPLSDRLQSDMSVSCNSSEYEQLLNTLPAEMASGGLIDRLKPTSRGHKKKHSNGGEGSPEKPAVDRSKVHVLVVEDNAINQQIATKTIKKLGFSVSAAWNGREALDYLMAAQQGTQPKPNIILMDVQMPVIDGYKTTHLLRHHLPYKTYVMDVPIVAMTASAIQGDREKCRKAGMDDYLAKPVRGKILEKMLDLWASRDRKIHLTSVSSEGSEMSQCSDAGEHCDNADIPGVEHDEADFVDLRHKSLAAILPGLSSDHQFRQDDEPTPKASSDGHRLREWYPTPPPLERTDTEQTALVDKPQKPPITRTDSTPGSAGKRQDTDKEMASTSRDDKLFDAADARTAKGQAQVSHQLPHSLKPHGHGGEALTDANLEKHDKEEAIKFEHRGGR
jgi:CheY-like chemotaxis protein